MQHAPCARKSGCCSAGAGTAGGGCTAPGAPDEAPPEAPAVPLSASSSLATAASSSGSDCAPHAEAPDGPNMLPGAAACGKSARKRIVTLQNAARQRISARPSSGASIFAAGFAAETEETQTNEMLRCFVQRSTTRHKSLPRALPLLCAVRCSRNTCIQPRGQVCSAANAQSAHPARSPPKSPVAAAALCTSLAPLLPTTLPWRRPSPARAPFCMPSLPTVRAHCVAAVIAVCVPDSPRRPPPPARPVAAHAGRG